MNCEKAQKWMSLDLDGELSPRRSARLRAHLESCPACRALRDEWARVGSTLRERTVPGARTAEAMWMDVRRAIRVEAAGREEDEASWVLGAPLRWVAATLLVMIVGAGLYARFTGAPSAGGPALASAGSAQVEFVETGLPDATPMVYEDADSGCTVIWVVEGNNKERGHAGS